jgi:hypothetical protein
VSASASEHPRQGVARHHHRRDQIETCHHCQLVVGERRVGGSRFDAGVVNQQVERADHCLGLLDQCCGLPGVGQISEH